MQQNAYNLIMILLLTVGFTAQAAPLPFPQTEEEWAEALSEPAQIQFTYEQSPSSNTELEHKGTRSTEGVRGRRIVNDLECAPFIVANVDLKGLAVTPNSEGRAGAIVQFAVNSSKIYPSAKNALDKLGRSLNGPLANAVLVVEGHSDSTGNPKYNMTLSGRRAEAVRRYLIKRHGISSARLRAKACGSSRPIASNDSERDKDRRVEFVRVN